MKNKNKNQIKKRIGAVLCALVVAVSALGVSVPYYASSKANTINGIITKLGFESVDIDDSLSYILGHDLVNNKYFLIGAKPYDVPIYAYITNDSWSSGMKYYLGIGFATEDWINYKGDNINAPIFCYADSDLSVVGKDTATKHYGNYSMALISGRSLDMFSSIEILYSDVDIVFCSRLCVNGESGIYVGAGVGGVSFPSYNSSLGYLQNVQRKSTYIRGALYNYDEESLTQHWYHGLTTTSGVDLTSGTYKIRHYISNATVTGYEKDDIVEMSDKYQVGEYDASKGYFSYLQKDYDDKLVEQGYKELGFVDTVFKGYFTLQHHYFQIVNTSTNEVGGYLHFYPKDAKGDNFWTDYVDLGYEGMDKDFAVDDEGPSGTIENIVGSGETVEDALENADSPKLGDLSGVDEVASNLEAYASQITNVTNGIGALLSEFPAWIVGLLGLSVALIFVVVVVKSLRG